MKPYNMKVANLLFIMLRVNFCIVVEIMFCISYNKPVEVWLTLMHYGKILHTHTWSQGKCSTWLHLVVQ